MLKFAKKFKPEIRFELGDVFDTTAMRSGARGTKDESRPLAPDYNAGLRWLERYEPTHISWGNHDWRIYELQDHHNAVISDCATTLWNRVMDQTKHIKQVPYDFEKNWFELGGYFWGHGFWYNEASVRDHAEYLGGPLVMAHLHHPQIQVGRTRKFSPSFCVGTLANVEAMGYARRRRATARWGHGVVWGEVCENDAMLHLTFCGPNGELRFPI